MPNIETYLAKIREAVYGEEVRGSIHDAIQAMNTDIDSSGQVNLRNSIAPVWNQSDSYEKGDYVWYPTTDGKLYKANRDVAAHTAWSTSNWDECTIATGLYEDVENLVKAQPAQPTEKINKIWIKDRESEVSVPTYDEFSDLKVANPYSVTREPISKEVVSAGITWEMNADGSVYVHGTASSTSLYNIYSSNNVLPDWAEKGKSYSWKLTGSPNLVWTTAYAHTQSRGVVAILDSYAGEGEFTIPNDSVGFILRLGVSSGKTVDETVIYNVFSEATNVELKEHIYNDNSPLFAKSESMLNGMQEYAKYAKVLMCNADVVGASIYDDSKWVQTKYRLSIPKHFIQFDRDTLIESLSDNFVFKMHECSSEGITIRVLGQWVTKFIARKNCCYVFTSKHADDTAFKDNSDFRYIVSTELQNKVDIHENLLHRSDAFLPFYSKFITASIDDDPLNSTKFIFNYGYKSRRSCFFKVNKPILLSMRDPNCSFRFYWYDNDDVYHQTAWGTLWETPVGVDVAMSIAKRTDAPFADDERPELELEAWDIDSEPKDYYLDEIEDTVNKVNNAFTEPGLCFLLSTDHHTMPVLGSNKKLDTISDMVVNMRAVAKRIKVDANIALGDIADFKVGTDNAFAQYGIKDTSYDNLDSVFYKWMDDAMVKLKSVHPNFYYVLGNHDDNRYINRDKIHASQSAYDYTPGEVFSYYISKGNHDVVYNNDNNGLDYYVNFEQFKIRAFFIDANYYNATSQTSSYAYTKAWWYGFASETVSWMEAQLSEIPEGWSVLVFSHMSPIKEHNEDNAAYFNFDNMKNVIQNFINGGGDYIATIYGHTHGDWSTSSPWLEMGFGCQKCENYDVVLDNMPGIIWPQRTEGTYTEDCWNVVLILPKSRKIKVIRFGAGDDQTFSY